MEGFNKAISFILGLVVVVVFIAVLTGRINLKNKIPSFTGGIFSRTTPTPTVFIPTDQPTTVVLDNQNQAQNTTDNQENTNYHQYQTNNPTTVSNGKTTSIPNTGPELFFPLVVSGLSIGLYFKNLSHKQQS